jgi:hypothetical protein
MNTDHSFIRLNLKPTPFFIVPIIAGFLLAIFSVVSMSISSIYIFIILFLLMCYFVWCFFYCNIFKLKIKGVYISIDREDKRKTKFNLILKDKEVFVEVKVVQAKVLFNSLFYFQFIDNESVKYNINILQSSLAEDSGNLYELRKLNSMIRFKHFIFYAK